MSCFSSSEKSSQRPMCGVAFDLLLWFLPRAFWIAILVIVVEWNNSVEGGMTLTTGGAFGVHSLCMCLAFPVFMSESILAYSSSLLPFVPTSKSFRVVTHITFHVFSVIAIVV